MADDRNRSRSPAGALPLDEIIRLVVSREQARLAKDFGSADQLRDQLTAMGVTLFDKSNSWRASDGRTGRIPSFTDIENGYTADQMLEEDAATEVAADGSDAHIKHLVHQREQARASKDWSGSDRIRDELKGLGVEIYDKEKMWRAKSGSSGVIIGYRGSAGPTDLEINTLVLQREKARQNSDWAIADMVRDELKRAGVEIMDKDKTWRASDGRSGPVPHWDGMMDHHGGQMRVSQLPQQMQMHMRPQPQQMQMQQHPQHHRGGVAMQQPMGIPASLQDQVVQAALAAARTPETAAQTLQLLRQVGHAQQAAGGMGRQAQMAYQQAPAAYRPQQAPAAPQMRSKDVASGPPKNVPEAREAITFMNNCQANGGTAQDSEIDWLVLVREKCRHGRDFKNADTLRDGLKNALGVEVFEKEKKWTSTDGRQGAIPMWSEIEKM